MHSASGRGGGLQTQTTDRRQEEEKEEEDLAITSATALGLLSLIHSLKRMGRMRRGRGDDPRLSHVLDFLMDC